MSNLKRRAVSANPDSTPAPAEAAPAPARRGKKAEPAQPAPEVVSVEEMNTLIAPPAASDRKLVSRRVDPNLMREAFVQFNAARGSKTPFLKLTGADNRIRILGPKDPNVNPLPFEFHKVHTWRVQGRNYEALDLDFLFGNAALAQAAIAAGKVTQDDFGKWQRFGSDPWNIAGNRIKDLGMGGKDSKAPYLFGSAKWVYNVIDRRDGGVYVWTLGKQKQQALEAIYAEADIFNEEEGHDLNVKGNGLDKNDRRYTVSVVIKPSPAGDFDANAMTDLRGFVLSRVKGWDAKVMALFGAYGPFLQSIGYTPASFGVQASTIAAGAVDMEESGDD